MHKLYKSNKAVLSQALRRKKHLLQGVVVDYVGYLEKQLRKNPDFLSKDLIEKIKVNLSDTEVLQAFSNRLVDRQILKPADLVDYGLLEYDKSFWNKNRKNVKINQQEILLPHKIQDFFSKELPFVDQVIVRFKRSKNGEIDFGLEIGGIGITADDLKSLQELKLQLEQAKFGDSLEQLAKDLMIGDEKTVFDNYSELMFSLIKE